MIIDWIMYLTVYNYMVINTLELYLLQNIFGASVSESNTSEFNCNLIYVYHYCNYFLSYVVPYNILDAVI